MVARGSNAVRPLAIVGHQYQSGGVDIQTPRGMQLVRHRLVEEIKDRWMIRIVGGTNVTLRLVEHKVARAGLLNQRIAVILDVMLRQKLEGGVFYNVAVHGNAAAADFTPGNSPANAKLLSDKLIKSHEIFLACTSAGAGNAPEKEEFHGVV